MVGLTGGIGAGKSTVAALLEARGAIVIDADQIAREVVAPGSPTLAALVERFGPDICDAGGVLDRAALARKAFVDEASKRALEAITHPAIGAEFLRRVAESPRGAVVVHDVPLLVEAGRGAQYGAVIVVEAPREVRLARLEARGIASDDAEARMAHQATDEERRAVATWVLDNGGDPEALERQVDAIWPELERRAGASDP
jgi:dephospho-CoA kinase